MWSEGTNTDIRAVIWTLCSLPSHVQHSNVKSHINARKDGLKFRCFSLWWIFQMFSDVCVCVCVGCASLSVGICVASSDLFYFYFFSITPETLCSKVASLCLRRKNVAQVMHHQLTEFHESSFKMRYFSRHRSKNSATGGKDAASVSGVYLFVPFWVWMFSWKLWCFFFHHQKEFEGQDAPIKTLAEVSVIRYILFWLSLIL